MTTNNSSLNKTIQRYSNQVKSLKWIDDIIDLQNEIHTERMNFIRDRPARVQLYAAAVIVPSIIAIMLPAYFKDSVSIKVISLLLLASSAAAGIILIKRYIKNRREADLQMVYAILDKALEGNLGSAPACVLLDEENEPYFHLRQWLTQKIGTHASEVAMTLAPEHNGSARDLVEIARALET